MKYFWSIELVEFFAKTSLVSAGIGNPSNCLYFLYVHRLHFRIDNNNIAIAARTIRMPNSRSVRTLFRGSSKSAMNLNSFVNVRALNFFIRILFFLNSTY